MEGNVGLENGTLVVNGSDLNHRQKRALIKKQKRKLKRQAVAKERDKQLEQEERQKQSSPSYAERLEAEATEEHAELLRIEAENVRAQEMWAWHEEMYAQRLREKQQQQERERLNRLETERKIKLEWEERQRKEKEEEEERRKKKEKQDELLQQARDAENKDSDWSNPLAPVHYGKERQVETCPFFSKVGACRFGDRCSRAHAYPEASRTVLFVGMFRHFQLDQGLCDEYDTDITLEYEDNEVYQKFRDFYEDTLPEFKAAGRVVQFKVCCNYQPHLRGNVYVSFSSCDEANTVLNEFNARWYGGKQMSGQLVHIPSWRRAICGLFGKGRCPKGKECNFMHVFKNPSNEFNQADRDMEGLTPHHRSNRGQRSRSRTPEERGRHRSSRYRSRSRDRESSRYSSRSRYSRQRSRSRSRERSCLSKNRSRSRERSYISRTRSKSRERSKRPRSRSREKKERSSDYKNRSSSKSKSRSRNSPSNLSLSSHDHHDSSSGRKKTKKRKHRHRDSPGSRSPDDESDNETRGKSGLVRDNAKVKVASVASFDTELDAEYEWVEKT